MLTSEEVAEKLNVPKRTVNHWASENRIPGFKIEGQWRFEESDIDDWLKSKKNKGK